MELNQPIGPAAKSAGSHNGWGSLLIVIGVGIPTRLILNEVRAVRTRGDDFPVKVIGHEGQPHLLKRIKAALKAMQKPVAMLVSAHGGTHQGLHSVDLQATSESDSDSEVALHSEFGQPAIRTGRIAAIAHKGGATLLAITACMVHDAMDDMKAFKPRHKPPFDVLLIGDGDLSLMSSCEQAMLWMIRFVCERSRSRPPSRIAPFIHLLHHSVLGVNWLKLTDDGFQTITSAAPDRLRRNPLKRRLDATVLSSLVKAEPSEKLPTALSNSELVTYSKLLLLELAQRADRVGIQCWIEDCKRLQFQSEADARVMEEGALFIVAELGRLDIVRTLMAKGVDMNARTKILQRTPLMLAIIGGARGIKLIEFLADRAATDLDAIDANGYTALGIAIDLNAIPAVDTLLRQSRLKVNAQTGDLLSPLLLATTRRRKRILELLIERKDLDANATDRHARSALIIAASQNWIAGVKILLRRLDLNVFQRNHEGSSALDLAKGTAMKKLLGAMDPFKK